MENEIMNDEMSAAELSECLSQPSGQVFAIDLMSNADYAGRHIPGAVNIPLDELGTHLSDIPKDKPVVLICRKGLTKSDMALEQLRKAGFTDIKKLSGGTVGWFEPQSA